MQKQNKIKTSFTLPLKIKVIIDILAQRLAISKTAVITLAILHFAKKEGVSVDDSEAG